MQLAIINHSFRYETENVIRIFFPLERINVVDFVTEEEDYIITKTENNIAYCGYKIDGNTGDKSLVLTDGADENTELAVAKCVYYALSELTGYTPPWGVLTGVRPSKLMRRLIETQGVEKSVKYFSDELLVSREKLRLAYNVARVEDRIVALSRDNSYSLYVSIPFCPSRCSYCSFVSHSVEQAKKLIPNYVKLLCRELGEFAAIARELDLKLETVYFGGGTPTSLDEESLKRITDTVGEKFDIPSVREYTIEAGRPDTLTREKLDIMKSAGVTRISINPQTFNDSVLENIGRKHTSKTTLNAFNMAREAGFDNINMDFIAGLPGDSLDSFKNSIETAISLDPENITVHTLALKRAARLVTSKSQDSVAKETGEMLKFASDALYCGEYYPYYMYRQSKSVGNLENVGWSKADKECLYNVYMMEEIHSVFAAGGGAVTKLKAPGENRLERIFNFKYPYEYINRFDELTERKRRIAEFYNELNNPKGNVI